ncbi:MAG: hypothetical protein ACI8WY_000974, partial [Planctomycetota bacterium]
VPGGEVGVALKHKQVPIELDSPPDTGFINFQRNLISIVAIARAHGATPVLMTQGIFSPAPAGNGLNSGQTRRAAQARITEVVRSVAKDREVPLVEMKPVLESAVALQIEQKGKQSLFEGSAHLSDDGTALLATTLAEELRRLSIL